MDTARRNTKQRELTLQIVQSLMTHPSAEEVYHEVKKLMPSVSLGTIYRNLGVLVDEGKIREVRFGGSEARFDAIISEHEHFVCNKCGAVMDLIPTLHTETMKSLAENIGAHITGYNLQYFGSCKKCSASE